MHPATRILVYLFAALIIPGLPLFQLFILFLVSIGVLIVLRRAPLSLIYRTRWLLLILLWGYAYSYPGESMWPALGSLAPSWQGFQLGATQAARLIVLLLWLDLLVLRLPVDELLSGLYQLMRPFSRLGIDPGRVAIRLGLTLRAIERLERGRGNLKCLLDVNTSITMPTQIPLRLDRFRWLDLVALGLAGTGLIVQWLSMD